MHCVGFVIAIARNMDHDVQFINSVKNIFKLKNLKITKLGMMRVKQKRLSSLSIIQIYMMATGTI